VIFTINVNLYPFELVVRAPAPSIPAHPVLHAVSASIEVVGASSLLPGNAFASQRECSDNDLSF
jgi:hypothetical protein